MGQKKFRRPPLYLLKNGNIGGPGKANFNHVSRSMQRMERWFSDSIIPLSDSRLVFAH